MKTNDPGNYGGFPTPKEHAVALRDEEERARVARKEKLPAEQPVFECIKRRMLVVMIDDRDYSVRVGVTSHVGAEVHVEVSEHVTNTEHAAMLGYLAGQIAGKAVAYGKRGGA